MMVQDPNNGLLPASGDLTGVTVRLEVIGSTCYVKVTRAGEEIGTKTLPASIYAEVVVPLLKRGFSVTRRFDVAGVSYTFVYDGLGDRRGYE